MQLTDKEKTKIIELVKRLERLADELAINPGDQLVLRNSSVAMMTAAIELVVFCLDGEHPQ